MSGRNRERKNKVIAIIASLALVVGLMPIPALAAAGPGESSADSPSTAAAAAEPAGSGAAASADVVKEGGEAAVPVEEAEVVVAPAEEPAAPAVVVEAPATPAEELSKAAASVEEPSEAAAPVEEPSKAAVPTEEESKVAAPAEDPSKTSAPAEGKSKAAAPVEGPSKVAQAAAQAGGAKAQLPAFRQSRTVGGVTVTVEADAGAFPEGAGLSVASVPSSRTEAAVAGERGAGENVAVSYTFDIKVLGADGVEIQPASGKAVSVSFRAAEVADPNLDVSVYHVPASGAAEELGVDVAGTVATAESDGFSYYTVEFTYNNLQYVLPGDSEVALAEILATVGLVGEPTDAVSSNSDLFGAEKRDGAWMVSAKQAFSSSETLTVAINGTEYEITVTDSTVIANGNCGKDGDNLTWTLDDEGTLTISGTGEMKICYPNAPWQSYKESSIKSVVIKDGVTSIGAYAFENCSVLKKATIPGSVKTIESHAFSLCGHLDDLTISPGVESIGEGAFSWCSSLESVVIPDSVKTIGQLAFQSCGNLANVTIGTSADEPCSVTKIGDQAFLNMAVGYSSQKTITINTYESHVTKKGGNWNGGVEVEWLWALVTATTNSSAGGTVTVKGGVDTDDGMAFRKAANATATLKAVPKSGYAFANWTDENGSEASKDPTYTFTVTADRTLTANFKPELTITVKDQTYAYDGQPQGEGDPAYEDPGVIAEKVTVEGLQGDDKLASIVLSGQETEHGVYEKAISVTGCQIKNEAGNITTENYAITCVPGTLTITVPLTITAASKTWTYDGDKHADTSVSAELPEGYVLDAYASGSVTNVSDTAKGNNPVAQGYKIYDPDGKDVTRSYVITAEPGTLTIEPEKATITVDSASKVQGTDDPVFAGKVEGLVKDGDLGEVKFVRTGDDEAPGTYKGVLTATYTANPNYDVTVVPGDFTIEAAPAEEYTVTFENWDGTVLQSGKVAAGEVPVYEGAEPTRPETDQYLYVFDGWTPEVVATTSDATYTAVFEPALRTYDIIWLNDDGTELYRDVHVSYGQMPDYDGPTPTKPSDGKYTYTFSGWTPEIVTVTGDATYTATYTATPKDKPVYKVVSGAGGTWTEGSGEPMVFKIERTVDPETAFSHFVGIEVDGKAVPEKDASGKANWTAKSGSVIIELQPAYLGTLSAGKHTLTALFDDGDPVTAEFKVAAKATSPKTGDPLTGALVVPIATAVIALIVMVAFAFRRRRV